MGFWGFLTKPRGLGSTAYYWSEPFLYRIRLRGDLLQRLAIMLAAWGLATGVLLILFAINKNPPGLPLGFGLGAVFGLGPGWIATFFLHSHTSGKVTVGKDALRRRRHYASISGQFAEWMDWPFDAMKKCVIVPVEKSGHPFSVMLISDGRDRDIVAIPSSVDLSKFTKHLTSHGITVTPGKSVPGEYTSPLATTVVIATVASGAGSFIGGLVFYLANVR